MEWGIYNHLKVGGWCGYIETVSSFSLLPPPSSLEKLQQVSWNMGNCQAIDAATLVIQHPCGKVDKFYWPVSASEIMRMNPGHYVALLISTTLCPTNTNNNKEECPNNNSSSGSSSNNNNNGNSGNSVRLTRIKLLRPTDTLVLGQVYRLITYEGMLLLTSCFEFSVGCFFLCRCVWFEVINMPYLVCGFRCYERIISKETCKDE